MIPCIFRSASLIKTGIKRNARILHYTSCHYSTNDQKNDDAKNFWENTEIEKKDPAVKSDSRDFTELLGALFDEALSPKEPFVPSQTPAPKKTKTNSIIEQKLLELIAKGTYKTRVPLPRVLLEPFTQRSDENEESYENIDKRKDRSILDEVEPFDYNWYKDRVIDDERIRIKEKEMSIKESIMSSNTVYELLDIVKSEINQAEYPKYYSSIVKAVLDYTSETDPYLALSIFEQIKAKSIQSYIKGCTVESYNIILLLKWKTWRDVNGMLDLLEEMSTNGIKVNSETRSIIGEAVTKVGQESDHTFADNQGLFWSQSERMSCNIMKEMSNKWLL